MQFWLTMRRVILCLNTEFSLGRIRILTIRPPECGIREVYLKRPQSWFFPHSPSKVSFALSRALTLSLSLWVWLCLSFRRKNNFECWFCPALMLAMIISLIASHKQWKYARKTLEIVEKQTQWRHQTILKYGGSFDFRWKRDLMKRSTYWEYVSTTRRELSGLRRYR